MPLRKQTLNFFASLVLMSSMVLDLQAQSSQKPLNVIEAFEYILKSQDSFVDLSRIPIESHGENVSEQLINKYEGTSFLPVEDGRIIVNKQIRLSSSNLVLDGFLFQGEVHVNVRDNYNNQSLRKDGLNVSFNNCVFERDVLVDGDRVSFTNVDLKANLYCTSEEFFGMKITSRDAMNYLPPDEGALTIFESVFLDTLLIDGRLRSLEIFNNEFKGDLDLSQAEPLSRFYLQRNKVSGKIVFSEFSLPDNSVLHWDFQPRQLAYALPEKNDSSVWSRKYGSNKRVYVSADNPIIFESHFLFLGLNALHKKFYDYFLARGDIQSANACYIEMKNIETSYYRYAYLKDGRFQNFLRWSLNWIIRVYTGYGTDPSLAILGSTYVILFFSVIFFFFPSDWDTTSHSLLKDHLYELRLKNSRNPRRILMLLRDLVVAMLIAITLSLNSFITIGFGNIPTSGVSRYACIIEGTLGWFLLTLFSVALISQLL